MTALRLAVSTFAGLTALAIAAHFWLPPAGRLPTHWGLDGQVNGTMPRLMALAAMPLLYAVVAGVLWVSMRQSQAPGAFIATTLVPMTIIIFAVEILLFVLMARTLRG